MAHGKRRTLTEQERAERRREEQQMTERAVAQLRCSAGWQRWLTVRAQVGLRRYSGYSQDTPETATSARLTPFAANCELRVIGCGGGEVASAV